MTEWTNLVSKVFKEKRATNKNYKFKNALVDAKKIYRKTTKTVDNMGPGLARKAAKSLKKAFRKTRKHRRHRHKKRRGGSDCVDGKDTETSEPCEPALNNNDVSEEQKAAQIAAQIAAEKAAKKVECEEQDKDFNEETSECVEKQSILANAFNQLSSEPPKTKGGKKQKKQNKSKHQQE